MSLSTRIYAISIQKCNFQVIVVIFELKQSKNDKNYIYDSFAVISGFEAMKIAHNCGCCTYLSLSTQIYVITIKECHFQATLVIFEFQQSKEC